MFSDFWHFCSRVAMIAFSIGDVELAVLHVSSPMQHNRSYRYSPPMGCLNMLLECVCLQHCICKTNCWGKVNEALFMFWVISALKLHFESAYVACLNILCMQQMCYFILARMCCFHISLYSSQCCADLLGWSISPRDSSIAVWKMRLHEKNWGF